MCGNSPCTKLVSPLLILTLCQADKGNPVQAKESMKRIWEVLENIKVNQEYMTDAFVASISVAATYDLSESHVLLVHTERAIKFTSVDIEHDIVQMSKLIPLWVVKNNILMKSGNLVDRMSFFTKEIKPKIINAIDFSSMDPVAVTSLQQNLLYFSVEHLSDLKKTHRIHEGLALSQEL